jgi:hypothetical protein
MTPLRAGICFVVLPALPVLTLVLVDVAGASVIGGRTFALVLACLVAALGSATVALVSERPPLAAASYGVVTGVLSLAALAVAAGLGRYSGVG